MIINKIKIRLLQFLYKLGYNQKSWGGGKFTNSIV